LPNINSNKSKFKASNQNFFDRGYEIKTKFISSEEVEQLKKEIAIYIQDKSNSNYGIRHIQEKIPAVYKLAYSDLIQSTLFKYFNAPFRLIRAIYFNKSIDANWSVPWHQDKTIAVARKLKLNGFTNWSIKEGVLHVQPPLEIMQNIITLRIHLDEANEENGALQLIPGSHQLGILTQEQIANIRTNSQAVVCRVNAADVVIMSPLILHSSLKSKKIGDRRIIHLEYTSTELPNGLNWV
jgi:hypothetical protein